MIPIVSMDVYAVVIAVAVMSGLGFSLASILAVANKKLYVFEDPRIDQVDGILPGSNCGACGLPGCRAFAEAVVCASARRRQESWRMKDAARV